jgi:hypothetical protein
VEAVERESELVERETEAVVWDRSLLKKSLYRWLMTGFECRPAHSIFVCDKKCFIFGIGSCKSVDKKINF